MYAPQTSTFTLALSLSLGLAACAKSSPTSDPPSEPGVAAEPVAAEPAADPLAGRPVVPNVDAKPGDVTTCPFSGRTFVVEAEHPRVEHEGKTYWICSEKAAQQVRADPAKYLDGFAG